MAASSSKGMRSRLAIFFVNTEIIKEVVEKCLIGTSKIFNK